MPKYIMECELHGSSPRTRLELQNISDHIFAVIQELGPRIQWVESHITPEKIYGVFIADQEQLVRQLALQVGLPVSRLTRVSESISPKKEA